MSVIGITGADGFLGWHLRCQIHALGNSAVRSADRATFGSEEALDDFVSASDVILHVAGVNRGEPEEVYGGNVSLAKALIRSKRRTQSTFTLVFANSITAGGNTPYGQSKAEAAEILSVGQADSGDRFVEVRLPHLFGEHGRPFYNSAMSTFAHQLATGGEPRIEIDRELELLHVQDAARSMLEAVTPESSASMVRPNGVRILVSDALNRLRRLALPYIQSGTVPELPELFDVRLFNMFRSQLFPSRCPLPLVSHTDRRGTFLETIRSEGKGQTSVSMTRPSVTRGQHFHFDKVERFVVIRGDAIIRIRRLLHREAHEYRVSGSEPVAIDMPTLHAHNVTNIGTDDLVTLFWSNDLFDPDNPDTIAETV